VACLVLSIVFIVVAAAFAIALASRQGGSQWNDAFRQVARRFHGVLHPGGWFQHPAVWIRHGEAQCRLSIVRLRGLGDERCLQMTIQQRDLSSRCEMFSHESRQSLLPSLNGLAAVEFDWKAFRRHWHVWTDGGDDVRQLLTDGVRLAIEQLIGPSSGGLAREMTISVSPGWLVVRKISPIPRGHDLEDFVERVCSLSDQLNLAAAAGIEFVAGDVPQLLEDARCGVCGDGLVQDIVVCRRCNTPHHRDCWQYGGGCATYACGGRECFVPAVAPLAEPQWENPVDRRVKPR
jgi:hypothetical protein